MEPFKVYVLGCGSAQPTTRHHASSQVVELRGKVFLVDCAEGTQVEIRRVHCRFSKLSHIFISHLHGDHCLGLVGLISSFGLSGRSAPLHVHAHSSFAPLLQQMLDFFCPNLSFPVVFHPVDTTHSEVVYEDHSLTVTTIPLEHRVPCCGYLFREKPTLPHIRRDMLDLYHIPISQISSIKNGADYITPEGDVIPSEHLVVPGDPPRSYAYCSDTRYIPTLHKLVKGVNLLYHESTYESSYQHLATAYYHSTAAEAARVARDAGAKHLLLGHYSSRYDDVSALHAEALSIFPHVTMAQEGLVIDVV